jgi:hypothetical protein
VQARVVPGFFAPPAVSVRTQALISRLGVSVLVPFDPAPCACGARQSSGVGARTTSVAKPRNYVDSSRRSRSVRARLRRARAHRRSAHGYPRSARAHRLPDHAYLPPPHARQKSGRGRPRPGRVRERPGRARRRSARAHRLHRRARQPAFLRRSFVPRLRRAVPLAHSPLPASPASPADAGQPQLAPERHAHDRASHPSASTLRTRDGQQPPRAPDRRAHAQPVPPSQPSTKRHHPKNCATLAFRSSPTPRVTSHRVV